MKTLKIRMPDEEKHNCPICNRINNFRFGDVCEHVDRVTHKSFIIYNQEDTMSKSQECPYCHQIHKLSYKDTLLHDFECDNCGSDVQIDSKVYESILDSLIREYFATGKHAKLLAKII